MHITRSQFKRIRHLLPKPRDSKLISHYRFLNALAYMVNNSCKWRAMPPRFDPWHTVYMRPYRWAPLRRTCRGSQPFAATGTEPVGGPSIELGLHHRQSSP